MKSHKRRKQSAPGDNAGLSRREFARGATVAAAALAAIPGSALGAAALAAPVAAAAAVTQQPEGEKPRLSPQAMAEVEAKIAEILRRYGDKLDDAQKADIRRLVREGQAPLEQLRAYPLANSDEPATILHLPMGGAAARRPAAAPAAAKPSAKPGA